MICSLKLRKKKAVHKATTTDDKRLQSTLKRVGVNTIPAIEEVNIFKDDAVIQFLNPKGWSTNLNFPSILSHQFFIFFIAFVFGNWWLIILLSFIPVQASIAANTWVVTGSPQTKSIFSFHFFPFLACLFGILNYLKMWSNMGCWDRSCFI